MSQVLELPHLVQHHRVADVDVGRGGVQTQLDAQRHAVLLRTCQLLLPFSLRDQFFGPPQRDRHRLPDAKAEFVEQQVISAGHFHGMPLALAMSYVKAAIPVLASIS